MFALTREPGGVAVVEIDRPPANAIGPGDLDELARVLRAATEDADCRALVFAARGRFFSAGADIKLMEGGGADAAARERLVDLARVMQATFDAIEALPLPTIAALGGIATGGGLELALACDLRVAAADARLGLTETRIGLIPGAGGTQRLVAVAGRAVALRMILLGELISGEEAARLGVVHESVDAPALRDRALALAGELAAQPRAALAAAKRCIRLAPSAQGYAAEIAATAELHASAETQACIAAFLRRRR